MPELDNMPVEGRKLLWVYQTDTQMKAGKQAEGLSFETAASLNKSRSTTSLVTKSGTYPLPAAYDYSGSATTAFGTNDPRLDELEDAIDTGEQVYFWLVNSSIPNDEGKYKSQYFKGYLTAFNITANAEGAVDATIDFALAAPGARGYATLSDKALDLLGYAFRDTVATV